MAQVDFTVTPAQYTTMMTVFDGVRTKLGNNRDVLNRVCSQEDGKSKIKAFAATEDGKWLREIARIRNELNTFFESVGWGDD